MELRDKLNRNTAFATVIAIIVMASAVAWIIYRSIPESHREFAVYFYDLGSTASNPVDRLFPGKSSDIPPIAAPSGKTMPDGTPAGVRAMVFACGSCTDPSARFVGYLLTRPVDRPEASSAGLPTAPMGPAGQVVRAPRSDAWVPLASTEGMAITDSVRTRCGGDQVLETCQPLGK